MLVAATAGARLCRVDFECYLGAEFGPPKLSFRLRGARPWEAELRGVALAVSGAALGRHS